MGRRREGLRDKNAVEWGEIPARRRAEDEGDSSCSPLGCLQGGVERCWLRVLGGEQRSPECVTSAAGFLRRREQLRHTAALWLLVYLCTIGGSDAECPAGNYVPGVGQCKPCAPGHASLVDATSCTQVMGGEPFRTSSAYGTVNFPQWQSFNVALGDTLRVGLRAYSVASGIETTVGARPEVTANEEWGLPEFSLLCGSAGTQEASFLCLDGTGRNTEALLEFNPRPEQVGERYSTCIKATYNITAGYVAQPMIVCVQIVVVDVKPIFSNTSSVLAYRTPPDGRSYSTAVGCSFSIPMEISASPCSAPSCTVTLATHAPTSCAASCGTSVQLGPPTSNTPLPDGVMITLRENQTPNSNPQFWVLEWVPKLGAETLIPYRMCLSPGPGGAERCFTVTVQKCRHCVGDGDTLFTIADVHNADWLELYLANPNLPSHNPHVVAPGYNLRLGVLHRVKPGEYMEQLADKFLVSTDHLLDNNMELWAPASVSFFPNAPGVSAQISVSFSATRVLVGGDRISIRLEGFGGMSWDGIVSANCSDVSLSSAYGDFAQELCGPGGWGVCKYDAVGKIFCEVKECSSYGQHPMLYEGMWDEASHVLTVVVREGALIPHGHHVTFVVSRNANILYPPTGKAESNLRAVFNVPTTIHIDGPRPYEMCVILPACDSKVQCIFGSDCARKE